MFPLYNDGLDKLDVTKYFLEETNILFPQVSNCVGCFFHSAGELRYQNETYPTLLDPWIRMEEQTEMVFNQKYSLKEILEGAENSPSSGSCFCSD